MRYLPLLAYGLALAEGGETQVTLGTAAPFGVLAGSTITNTGASTITGDIGVYPGTSVTGFPPGVVIGTQHVDDAVAQQAEADAKTAYDDLAGLAASQSLQGQDLGGLKLTAGVYNFASSGQLTGSLTLDAQGNPNAMFVFQFGSTITTASASQVIIINGGQACNVYWQVGSSATLGTGTEFIGNILALTSITVNTGVTITGGLYALNAAITLQDNNINAQESCITSMTSSITSATTSMTSSIATSTKISTTSSTTSPTTSMTSSIATSTKISTTSSSKSTKSSTTSSATSTTTSMRSSAATSTQISTTFSTKSTKSTSTKSTSTKSTSTKSTSTKSTSTKSSTTSNTTSTTTRKTTTALTVKKPCTSAPWKRWKRMFM